MVCSSHYHNEPRVVDWWMRRIDSRSPSRGWRCSKCWHRRRWSSSRNRFLKTNSYIKRLSEKEGFLHREDFTVLHSKNKAIPNYLNDNDSIKCPERYVLDTLNKNLALITFWKNRYSIWHSICHTYIHIHTHTHITLEQWTDHPGSDSSHVHELPERHLEEEHGDSSQYHTDQVRQQKGAWSKQWK